MTDQVQRLEEAIAAQERLRGTIPDDVVDAAIAALREKLAAASAAASTTQQRKLVTVLFADASGFTALSETMDAEDVAGIVNAYWERLDRVIQEHRGRIDKHMGDGVMALWGAAQSREDDPEMAVRAALAMQEELARMNSQREVSLAMRIGINTGPVLLGEIGLTQEYTAMGDTVNVAARLEQAAPLGGVLISHDTYRHVHGAFDVQALGGVTVKGKAQPVQAYRVLRAHPHAFRMGRRGVKGVATRMIGREAELARLQSALQMAVESGLTQVITVIGEAGIGKSRLLYEFERWIDAQFGQVQYFKGRAFPESQSQPYALLRDLFAFRFQVREDESARAVQEKLEQGIMAVLGRHERGRLQAHFIARLLGFSFDSPYLSGVRQDPQQLHDRALLYLVEFFRVVASRAPTVVFVEDLHWADQSSLDALGYLVQALPESRLLLVGLARPSLLDRVPDWQERMSGSQSLYLEPLNQDSSRLLALEILQRVQEIPVGLRELLVSGSEGNPFYIEELVKMLIEDQVILVQDDEWRVDETRLVGIRVPPTLTRLLQARLDGLMPAELVTLQQASVVGRVFWDDSVAYLNASSEQPLQREQVGGALAALQAQEMIFQRGHSAFERAQEYIFKHALLRDVTYESVLKRLRRVYHGLAAQWLIEQSGERRDEYLGLIAEHLELAEKRPEAVAYLRRAGEQAAHRYANAEALRYLSRALALTPPGKWADRYDLLLQREQIYGITGERAAQGEDLIELAKLAEQMDDDWLRAQVAALHARFAYETGDYAAALASAQQAASLGGAVEAWPIAIQGYQLWANVLIAMGDYEAARRHGEMSLALARRLGDVDAQMRACSVLSDISLCLGEAEAAQAFCQQAWECAHQAGNHRYECHALYTLGSINWQFDHDALAARTCFEQFLSIARETGDRVFEALALQVQSWLADELGEYGQAVDLAQQALALVRSSGSRFYEIVILLTLGRALSNLGEHLQALPYLEQALQMAEEGGRVVRIADALRFLGEPLTGLGRLDEAAGSYRRAIDLYRQSGNPEITDARAGLAYAYLMQNALGPAMEQVEVILESVREEKTLISVEQPLRVLWICHQVLTASQDRRADDVLVLAGNLLQDILVKYSPAGPRSFLENVPWNREILALVSGGSRQNATMSYPLLDGRL